MFYVRLFGVIFILIATFFIGLFLILFTRSDDTAFDVAFILGIAGLVIAFIALLISGHEQNEDIKKKFGTGTFTTMQKNAFWASDEGKKFKEKWNERIKTILILGALWFFSSFAMLFVAMAFLEKFLYS